MSTLLGDIKKKFFFNFKFFENRDFQIVGITTVVGDYLNIMKTNFDFNFDLYHAVKQHGYT